jgi:hypothetical protein
VAWGIAVAAHQGLRTGDASTPDVPALRPSAELWAATTLGRRTAAASVLWMQTVTRFVALEEPDVDSVRWMEEAIVACAQLDPRWRAPSAYGALMLGSLGEVDAYERVLEAAARRWPDDPWYPTALGMSRYLHRGDPDGAARWLEWAASVPDASPIHAHAAARMQRRAGALP